MMKKVLICLLAMVLLVSTAMAEGAALEGTVVATRSAAVLAPAAGVVQDVLVQAGQHVTAGQEVAALMETIAYAEVSGAVKLFGQEGESVETITTRYGAVMYIEQDLQFSISASTRNAYDDPANKIIHPGEKVYIRCTTNSEHTGAGEVTAISGSSYTVEVTEGSFADGEGVYIYRSEDHAATSRIGKGTANYADAVACTGTGTGSVAEIFVADGDHVEEGTPLFSTVEASAYSADIRTAASGTVATLDVTPGTAVEAGALVATVYPDDAIRLEILADEIDLRSLAVGQSVTVTFANGVVAQGQVESISGLQYVAETTEEGEEDNTAYFPVYVAFQTDAPIACGMTAKVTIAE